MEQVTVYNEDGSITIIATMVPADGTPPSDVEPGLQLVEEEEVRS